MLDSSILRQVDYKQIDEARALISYQRLHAPKTRYPSEDGTRDGLLSSVSYERDHVYELRSFLVNSWFLGCSRLRVHIKGNRIYFLVRLFAKHSGRQRPWYALSDSGNNTWDAGLHELANVPL